MQWDEIARRKRWWASRKRFWWQRAWIMELRLMGLRWMPRRRRLSMFWCRDCGLLWCSMRIDPGSGYGDVGGNLVGCEWRWKLKRV
ncbi:hypothetical protein M5689_004059 [Euphorbia peplus]|nr:hypothetical protein M5689_004059 [Euphorbia peplus]